MKLQITLVSILVSILSSAAFAQSIIMEGDYVRSAVSNNGTLGLGGSASPGLQHDPTGTRTWGSEDYLTPGSPWEVFSVRSAQTGLRINNNTGGAAISTINSPFNVAGSSFDTHVRWDGRYSSFYDISHEYFFNDGFERIDIRTTLTALTDLDSVSFLRAIDPDPDSITHGSFSTINTRGAAGVAPEDFVNSQGSSTGLTLGLYADSPVTHNTGITNWSDDPAHYLPGPNLGNGDYTIGLAFYLGDLLSGQSMTLDYSYVMGGSLETVDLPDHPISAVPEPSTYGLMGAGLLVALVIRRRMKEKA